MYYTIFIVVHTYLQVRDDYRTGFDEQRGGVGGGTLRQMERQGFDTSSLRLSIGDEENQ